MASGQLITEVDTVAPGPPPAAGGEAAEGRQAAFEALLLPVLEPAYATALMYTRNSADAEDLVQEAALLACRGFGSFQPGTNFRAWFLRIVTNCFFQKCRRDKRTGAQVELEDADKLYLYSATAALGMHERPDPAAELMGRLDEEHITAAIEALPLEYRVVATLYFVQDATYQDIADTLDIPVGTVRSRLHRARRALQRELWHIAQERGLVAAPVEGD